MRILHMALPSLALAVLLGLGLAYLQGQAALASSCDPKNDRMVINFPGVGKIVTTRGELEDAWYQYLAENMEQVSEDSYASVTQDQVTYPIHGLAEGWEPQTVSQTDAPGYNMAAFVMWCMVVHMEQLATPNDGASQ